MDHAPAMTAAQWRALIILAEDANDGTRLTWSSVQSKKIMDRIGLPKGQWANLRTALVRKGLLEIAEAGVKGRVAKYRFPAYGKMLHESDEAFSVEPTPEPEIPHQIYEASAPMPNETDEASGECFTGSMTPTPLVPPLKNTPLSHAALVRAASVVHEDEEREFIEWIKTTHKPRGMPWWRAVASNGDFAELAESWREHVAGAAMLRGVFSGTTSSTPLPDCQGCHRPMPRSVIGDLCGSCRASGVPEGAGEVIEGYTDYWTADKDKGAATGSSSPPTPPPLPLFDHEADQRRKDAEKQRKADERALIEQKRRELAAWRVEQGLDAAPTAATPPTPPAT